MRQVIAQTKNLHNLAEVGQALSTRTPDLPGIGMIWGPSGLGKTTAAVWFRRPDGCGLRARAVALDAVGGCSRHLPELDVLPAARCALMLDTIVERLATTQRPLIVDEADYLLRSGRLLDTLRDLHDVSSAPVIVIGMADFRRRVASKEQFAGRIAQTVEFRPADLADVRTTAEACCEVELDDDLLERITRETQGSMRRVKVALSVIERWADRRGSKR